MCVCECAVRYGVVEMCKLEMHVNQLFTQTRLAHLAAGMPHPIWYVLVLKQYRVHTILNLYSSGLTQFFRFIRNPFMSISRWKFYQNIGR